MDIQIAHTGSIEIRDTKTKWKSRWAILEKSDRNVPPPEDVDQDNMRHSCYTNLVIRKNKDGEVKQTIPLIYLCVVDKYSIDKKSYGITLMIADRHTNLGETYQIQCESQSATDVWLELFNSIVGAGMHKYEVKIPKVIKTKYFGTGYLYFYEQQKFISITTDAKIPIYWGTWPIQLLRRYGGDDPNKFVFESGRRCFGGVNFYHIASPQAYDIRTLCNRVSSSAGGGVVRVPSSTTSLASATIPGYADNGNEPRYRSYPGGAAVGARPRQSAGSAGSCGGSSTGERPLTVVSNSSMASTNSKRSSGSSFTGESARQLSLDRSGRPVSDALDSGVSFRSSNNSILSNRSSRGSYSSETNIQEIEVDSGIDTIDSRSLQTNGIDDQEMYMVMQPAGAAGMPPITETGDLYERMGALERGGRQSQESNYMVPRPALQHQPRAVATPKSPQASDSYMNMDPGALPSNSSQGAYMNLDLMRPAQPLTLPPAAPPPAYMNLSELPAGGAAGGRRVSQPGEQSNYMNLEIPASPVPAVTPAPIYDTPTSHLRKILAEGGKSTATCAGVSNPIYGNGSCPPKLQT